MSQDSRFDSRLVSFHLSEGFSRFKRLNLAYRALLTHRYDCLKLLNDLEERLLQGPAEAHVLEACLEEVAVKAKLTLLCLHDLAPGRFLWLFPILDQKMKEARELLPQKARKKVFDLREIDLRQASLVGAFAARLGEVRNILKIPVPETKVICEGSADLEEFKGQSVFLWFSPQKDWPFWPPVREIKSFSPEKLKAFLKEIRDQALYWPEKDKERLCTEGTLLIQKSPSYRIQGWFYPVSSENPQRPQVLIKETSGVVVFEESRRLLSSEKLVLLENYAQGIMAHLKGPHVLSWIITHKEELFITGLCPVAEQGIWRLGQRDFFQRHRLRATSVSEILSYSRPGFFSLWRKVIPFTMDLPESEDLSVVSNPSDFDTLQDVITFAHEAGARELFHIGKQGPLHVLQDPRLPVAFFLWDLGHGIRRQALFQREVSIADLRCRPLHVLWQGMTHEGISWKGPVEFNLGGFFSVLSRSFVEGRVTKEGGKGYILLTQDYLYLRLRLAYHLMVVEAFFHAEEESYLLFRLQGGGAGSKGRQQRFLLLKDILERLDFKVEIVRDLLQALYLSGESQELYHRLDQLGRLLGFSRQLDMTLADERVRQRYVEAFLKGHYSVFKEQ